MIGSIPLVQTTDRNVNQLQQNIKQAVGPVLGNALVWGNILTNVNLVQGDNTISHGLGRTLQGWIIVRYHGAWAQIYDNQDSNGSADATLLLNASAPVQVNIYVF